MSTTACEEYLEFLLSAEPQQLRGEHEWHGHLQTCALCRTRTRAILAENEALDAALGSLTGRQTPDAGWSAAPAVARRSSGRRRRLVRWAPGLAALAAAATLLLVLWQVVPRAPLPPLAGPVVRVPATPTVNASGARGVAVMRTNNPDITVVWTF